MPRTKASPQASPPSLQNVVVTFASYQASAHAYFEPKNLTQLKAEIAACGGIYTSKVDLSTHLVASKAQFDKQLLRVTEALRQPHVTLVSYDWLAASLASTVPVDCKPYVHVKSGADGDPDAESDADGQPTPQKPKKPLKRERQGEDEEDQQDLVVAKKAKHSYPVTSALESDAKASTPAATNVPVDGQCQDAESYRVYIDDFGVAYDATLSKSDSTVNNNKFYRMQLLHRFAYGEYFLWSRWGRVGDNGLAKLFGNGTLQSALHEFQKKFKEKSGNTWANRDIPARPNKYTYIEMNYEESDEEKQPSTAQSTPRKERVLEEQSQATSQLHPAVQSLMNLIFDMQLFKNTMASLDYDAIKMPLGKLSKKTLLKGYEVLKDLATIIADSPLKPGVQGIQEKSNQYFSLVPHVVNRRSVPVLSNMDLIKVCLLTTFALSLGTNNPHFRSARSSCWKH